jgi:phosphopantothenoylcysteine decarboxylase/phosphopantothenate--cysteine ligase
MVEPQELMGHIRWALGQKGDLAGRTLVVTAGGTQEPIDPVRMVTNRSSGKMGYAVAEAARDRGAKVVLVTAPTALEDPVGVQVVRVGTAQEMQKAVVGACQAADALIMAAAVSDYRPVAIRPQKVKKTAETWTLELVRTPEILGSVEGDLVKVGFAAETEELLTNARKKLTEKGLHLIAANDVSAGVFGADTNKVVLLDRQGGVEELPLMTKYEVAHRILDRVAALLPKR